MAVAKPKVLARDPASFRARLHLLGTVVRRQAGFRGPPVHPPGWVVSRAASRADFGALRPDYAEHHDETRIDRPVMMLHGLYGEPPLADREPSEHLCELFGVKPERLGEPARRLLAMPSVVEDVQGFEQRFWAGAEQFLRLELPKRLRPV